jgi:predicted nucleic acid-binding Zn ribbon protein
MPSAGMVRTESSTSKKELAVRSRIRATMKGSGPQPVGVAMKELAHKLGITKTLSQYSVITLWESIVGEQIARVTTAQRMENGILFVGVKTAPWRAELSMRRLEITEKINNALGKKVVKDIRFR